MISTSQLAQLESLEDVERAFVHVVSYNKELLGI